MAAVLQYTLPGVPCIYYGDENAMEGFQDPFCRRCFDWINTDEELLIFYRKLGKIRKAHSVFMDGEYKEIFADSGFLMYSRTNEHPEESVYIYVNNSFASYTIRFSGTFLDLLSGTEIAGSTTCGAKSYGIFVKLK